MIYLITTFVIIHYVVNAMKLRMVNSTSFIVAKVVMDIIYEPVHEISNNLVCATSKASDQPAHTRSLIRAFACRLSIQ